MIRRIKGTLLFKALLLSISCTSFFVKYDIHNIFLFYLPYLTLIGVIPIWMLIVFFKNKENRGLKFRQNLLFLAICGFLILLGRVNAHVSKQKANDFAINVADKILVTETAELPSLMLGLGFTLKDNAFQKNYYSYDYRFTTIKYPVTVIYLPHKNLYRVYVYHEMDSGLSIDVNVVSKNIDMMLVNPLGKVPYHKSI